MTDTSLQQKPDSMVNNHFKLAYGLLWKSRTDCPLALRARKILLSLMDKEDQRMGIQLALDTINNEH